MFTSHRNVMYDGCKGKVTKVLKGKVRVYIEELDEYKDYVMDRVTRCADPSAPQLTAKRPAEDEEDR